MRGSDKFEIFRKALAEYITILAKSAAETNWAEDRKAYEIHLADAALMFAAIENDRSIVKLKQLIAAERHGYGWGYLRGSFGNSAESAFNTFAKLVEMG